jgi:hypothetical protein
VPETLADQVLEIARKLDDGESIDNAQNQCNADDGDRKLQQVREILNVWVEKASHSKPDAPRYKNARKLIREISLALAE